MLGLLRPDLYVGSLFIISLDELWQRGLRALIVDLDNTITEWNLARLRPEVRRWFADARERGFKVCLVSNNSETRVNSFASALDIPWISNAGKPRRRAFRQAMAKMGVGRRQTAVVGDQVFTDVLGGNRLGLYTILVVPMTDKEFIGTRLARRLERWVLRRLQIRLPQQ